MKTISKGKLKATMLRVFREIEQTGEELIVTDHNRPVLKIEPIRLKQDVRRVFGDVKGPVIYHEDLTTPTAVEWEEV